MSNQTPTQVIRRIGGVSATVSTMATGAAVLMDLLARNAQGIADAAYEGDRYHQPLLSGFESEALTSLMVSVLKVVAADAGLLISIADAA